IGSSRTGLHCMKAILNASLPPSVLERNLDEYATGLAGLKKELGEIPSRHPNAGSRVLDLLNPLWERLKGMETALNRGREAARRNNRKEEMLASLPAFASSAQRLADQLNLFAKEFPDDPRAAPFREAAGKQPLWSALCDYHAAVAGWESSLQPKDLPDLDRRLQGIKAYLDKHNVPFNPAALATYTDYLTLARKALQPDGPWKGELNRMVNGPLMRKLRYVKTTNGKVYYIPPDAETRSSPSGVQTVVIVSKDMNTKKKFIADPAFTEPKPAPQVALSEAIEKKIQNLSLANWDAFGLEVMQLIQKAGEVDPVLRLALHSHVLIRQAEMFWSVDPAQRVAPKDLEESLSIINDVNWVDPDDKEVAQGRKVAQEQLSEITKAAGVDRLLADLPQVRQRLLQSLSTGIVGCGVVVRNQGGWMAMAESGRLIDGRKLLATVPGPGGKSVALREIGAIKGGKAVIADKDMNDVPEGSLVFVVEK
ncbi:MAG: hypothetical protein ACPMAQ_18175, partial [Phycisphaerae bacterium]